MRQLTGVWFVVWRRADTAYCSSSAICPGMPDIAMSRTPPVRWDLGYLGTYSADRQPGLDSLLLEPARKWPRGRFAVVGAMYPDDIVWPANVEAQIHLSPREHSQFYGSQRFSLNITPAEMK